MPIKSIGTIRGIGSHEPDVSNLLSHLTSKALKITAESVNDTNVCCFRQSIKSAKVGDFDIVGLLTDDEVLEQPLSVYWNRNLMEQGIVVMIDAGILKGNGTGKDAHKKKETKDAFKLLMAPKEMQFPAFMTEDELENETLQNQIKNKLKQYCSEKQLGYTDAKTERELHKFVNVTTDVLCYMHRHWDKLIHNTHAVLPDNELGRCGLMQILATCTRKGSKKKNNHTSTKQQHNQVTQSDLSQKMSMLDSISLSALLKSSRTKDAAEDFSRQLLVVTTDSLQYYKQRLQALESRRSNPNQNTNNKGKVPSSFKDCAVVASNDGTTNGVIPGRKLPLAASDRRATAHSKQRRSAFDSLHNKLRQADLYEPVHLTDVDYGIPQTVEDYTVKSQWRAEFRQLIRLGFKNFPVGISIQNSMGNHPSHISVFRLAHKYKDDSYHNGRFANAIKQCETDAPVILCKRDRDEFNRVMQTVAKISQPQINALRRLILGDQSRRSVTEHQEKEIFEFLVQVAAGEDVEEQIFNDMRMFNSRGGMGIGVTQLQAFWSTCHDILHGEMMTGVEERRKASSANTLYASRVISIRDLRDQAKLKLQHEVDKGNLKCLPSIPSLEWIRMQFVPNNDLVSSASRMTGRLDVRRKIQLRTLRKQHPDQHWVNSYTRYHLQWAVEVNNKDPLAIAFVGQDDKCKIKIGQDKPISTNVRSRNGAIVPNGHHPAAADHDFSNANIIPSVTLRANIPGTMAGTFFVGGEDGKGRIEVTVRDATFDGSDVFDHNAQLLESILGDQKLPFILLIQTDGGPDHSLKFLRSKLALVALFLVLGIDHLVAVRCAPQGSFMCKAERAMSFLNFGLENLALVRLAMPPWAEKLVQNAQSMKDVRQVVAKFEQERQAQIDRLEAMKETTTEASSTGINPRQLFKSCTDTTKTSTSTLAMVDFTRQAAAQADGWSCGELIPTFQGKVPGTINSCVVISYLLVTEHLGGHRSLLSHEIADIIDRKTPMTISSYQLRRDGSFEDMRCDVVLESLQEHLWPQFNLQGDNVQQVLKQYDQLNLPLNRHDSPDSCKVQKQLRDDLQSTLDRPPSYQVAGVFFANAHQFAFYREVNVGPPVKLIWHVVDSLQHSKARGCSQHYIFESIQALGGYLLAKAQALTSSLPQEASLERRINTATTFSLNTFSTDRNYQIAMNDKTEELSREERHALACQQAVVARLEKNADEMRTRDLKAEWAASMKGPIDVVSERFSNVSVGGRNVKVIERCKPEVEERLHEALKAVDPDYSKDIRYAADLKKIPKLATYIKTHVVMTTYHMSIQKCGLSQCKVCKHIMCPEHLRSLVMQRQPTPLLDKERIGHFVTREAALQSAACGERECVDLSDLPSVTPNDKSEGMKARKLRDSTIGKEVLSTKSWDASQVRASVTCWECGKRRCLYSKSEPVFAKHKSVVQVRVETSKFVCGALLFDDAEDLAKLITQKTALECSSIIEKQYYNPVKKRAFLAVDICIYCGSEQSIISQATLEELNQTDGKSCYPICTVCFDNKFKVLPKTRAKAQQSQTKKENSAKKRQLQAKVENSAKKQRAQKLAMKQPQDNRQKKRFFVKVDPVASDQASSTKKHLPAEAGDVKKQQPKSQGKGRKLAHNVDGSSDEDIITVDRKGDVLPPIDAASIIYNDDVLLDAASLDVSGVLYDKKEEAYMAFSRTTDEQGCRHHLIAVTDPTNGHHGPGRQVELHHTSLHVSRFLWSMGRIMSTMENGNCGPHAIFLGASDIGIGEGEEFDPTLMRRKIFEYAERQNPDSFGEATSKSFKTEEKQTAYWKKTLRAIYEPNIDYSSGCGPDRWLDSGAHLPFISKMYDVDIIVFELNEPTDEGEDKNVTYFVHVDHDHEQRVKASIQAGLIRVNYLRPNRTIQMVHVNKNHYLYIQMKK